MWDHTKLDIAAANLKIFGRLVLKSSFPGCKSDCFFTAPLSAVDCLSLVVSISLCLADCVLLHRLLPLTVCYYGVTSIWLRLTDCLLLHRSLPLAACCFGVTSIKSETACYCTVSAPLIACYYTVTSVWLRSDLQTACCCTGFLPLTACYSDFQAASYWNVFCPWLLVTTALQVPGADLQTACYCAAFCP